MKKKVMILVPSLSFSGGAEKVAASLSRGLSKKYDISIITLFHYENIYSFTGKYYSLKENHHFGGIIFRLFKINKIIKFISPDIIISFMNYTSFWTIIAKYLYRINIPLIISVNSNPNLQYKKKIYYKYFIRFLYPLKKISGIVPVSKELKKILIKNYKIDKNKITPIYNGIDIEKIKNMAKKKIAVYEDVFNNEKFIKFITIGRLSGEKGHKYFIRAFSHVIKEIPNSKLFIIGEGPIKHKLEGLIKSIGLKDHAILLGLKKNPFKYISKATIFVLSSLHEGLPYVLIEAMACGLPIISTNCKTGPKEILENGKYGILANVADSSDLANKMIDLAKNKGIMEELARKSYKRVKIFEYRKFIENWTELLDSYLN